MVLKIYKLAISPIAGKENSKGKILVNLVGRYENLVADFHYFCETLGSLKLDLVHIAATKHRPYQEVYTGKLSTNTHP